MNVCKIKQKKDNKKGFTLIEVIVAVGIFSLVMMVALGAIISIVGANKKAQALHNVINNLNLAVESMVREMRTGYDYECGTGDECTSFAFKSKQINQDISGAPVAVVYELKNNSIQKSVDGGSSFLQITSDDVNIEILKFYAVGINDDTKQPLVLMVLKGTAMVGGKESQFNIQTLISQRLLNLRI